MTREDRNLLTRELCSRLPYGVVCEMGEGREHIVEELKMGGLEQFMNGKWTVKPYLRPIKSLTDEEMDKMFDILGIDKSGNGASWIKINDVGIIRFFIPEGKDVEDMALEYDYLNSIHIDYRGLISKGLAIEVNVSNNPYNKA